LLQLRGAIWEDLNEEVIVTGIETEIEIGKVTGIVTEEEREVVAGTITVTIDEVEEEVAVVEV